MGTVRTLWDEHAVYVLFDVQDSVLNADSVNAHEQDSVEILLTRTMEKRLITKRTTGSSGCPLRMWYLTEAMEKKKDLHRRFLLQTAVIWSR